MDANTAKASLARSIVALSAQVCNAPVGSLYTSVRKSAAAVRGRGIAAYVMRLRGFSYPAIAAALHRDEHTSVMAMVQRTADAIARGEALMVGDVGRVEAALSLESELPDPRAPIDVVSMRVNAIHRELLDLRAEVEEGQAVIAALHAILQKNGLL